MDDDVFHKVMVFQESEDAWSVALVRVGFSSKSEALRWCLEYRHPNKTPAEIERLYGEIVERAFRDF